MLKHYKGDPSKFIIKYVSGKIKKQGYGISFMYWKHNASIIAIPATTIDSHFIFNEITKNFQTISLQGHFTYKINDPSRMNTLLNFQIDPESDNYKSEDPEKLELRIKNVVQMKTRSEIKKLDLEEALAINTYLADTVIEYVKNADLLEEMGAEVLSITFNSIKPTPEIAKALEAEYREGLQEKADKSIYARRASAVEQERKIRENELNTDIALEKQKEELVQLNGENIIKEADFKSKAKNLEMQVFEKIDPRLLLALSMNELSSNASKIGNLTITSEMLSSLLN
ncbi:MAG: SPFH domain-containing protein [Candidatus Heimdallarchaeota archaeon]|nr:SPFH domain-containing protein [Candidatus Heimdallarchaeota archaeon]MDH5645052.1 SPFH domain-containing protein [Candidatus Heimdallarchaeota archaeon]